MRYQTYSTVKFNNFWLMLAYLYKRVTMIDQKTLCKSLCYLTVAFTIYAQCCVGRKIATLIVVATSFMGYIVTVKMIPIVKPYMIKARIFGKDINKLGTEAGQKEIPEALGIVSAFIFVIVSLSSLLVFGMFYCEQHLAEKYAALLCIVLSMLLGFVDDVLDIPWRYKLIIPLFGILPVLVAYNGVTYVLIPTILRPYLGATVNLSIFYYIYMAMLGIFATNSINIYAGINGLEVGQSIIIGCTIAIYNSIQLVLDTGTQTDTDRHLFSLVLMVPFLLISLGLFRYNAYPSQVFIGDTYCYFAGMVLVTVGIIGHFSKTLLLFFIPQILNFLYSIPQLFKFVPCPRHRLPKYNMVTGKLQAIKTNMNLVNLALWALGPMREDQLCSNLLVFQVGCSILALLGRYFLSAYLF